MTGNIFAGLAVTSECFRAADHDLELVPPLLQQASRVEQKVDPFLRILPPQVSDDWNVDLDRKLRLDKLLSLVGVSRTFGVDTGMDQCEIVSGDANFSLNSFRVCTYFR